MRRALSRTAQPILHGARTPANAHGLRLVIEQWGNAGSPVTFPMTFPTACMNVVATIQTSGDGGNMSKNRLCVNNVSKTGFGIENPQGSYRYFAIGY